MLPDSKPSKVNSAEFKRVIPLAILCIGIFFLIQKLGAENYITSAKVNYVSALLIGFIASISTCMAILGGLVLSISANYAKEGSKLMPQAYFHIGRLASFFILGGIIGLIGKSFVLSSTGSLVLNLVIALVLITLGIKLLDIFPWADNIRLMLPDFMGNRVAKIQNLNHTFMPLIIGAATFFLPCGFTQSMQIYSLSTGSFIEGALTMLFFSIGTLPVLALLSFGSLGLRKKMQSDLFFKTAGVIVIFFGLFNAANALKTSALFQAKQSATTTYEGQMSHDSQLIEIDAKGGYSPAHITARAGVPTILKINTKGTFDCSAALSIPSLGYWENLPPSGITEIQIPPQESGKTIEGLCQMGMYNFEIRFD